jgi:hypothetical protein
MQRGTGQQLVDGANFRLMDEVRYVQDRAAEHDSRLVILPRLLLFSTQTGRRLVARSCRASGRSGGLPWRSLAGIHRGDGEELCHWLDGNLTAWTARPSSTLKQSLGVSALFSATQYGSSSSRRDPKISNIFG